ncbi:MAG: gliding motility-associated C-terminal domain-containing protein, partial [Bacteroidia bacterium]|nr:gliding motility-associated C-terminal domain-containing protein [Bacteroidia bacterium]
STQDISVFAFAPADFSFLIDTCTAQLFFRNNSVNALTNIWDFGDNASSFAIAPVHSYSRFGSYSVSLITNPGSACADTATIPLKYDLSFVGNIFIPNAFTPNEDGTNDIFEVVGYYPCDDFTFYIYNRWGELVYKTISGHISWDGTYKGKFVEGGIYVYILKEKNKERIGSIAVLR